MNIPLCKSAILEGTCMVGIQLVLALLAYTLQ